jgi:Pectate lyase superfamily protein
MQYFLPSILVLIVLLNGPALQAAPLQQPSNPKKTLLVKDISALKKSRPLNGTVALTQCYARPGDLGGGRYVFELHSVLEGNNQDIIAPADPATTGRWIIQPTGNELLITSFGATGDGKKDNTEILRTVLRYTAAKRLHAVIPPGVFLFNPGESGIGLSYGSWCWLEGRDSAKCILKAIPYKGQGRILIGRSPYSTDQSVFHNIVFKKFTLDGSERFDATRFHPQSPVKDSLQQLMLLYKTDSARIEEVAFVNGGAGGGIGLAAASKIHISKNSFAGLGRDCINANGYDTSNHHIYIERNNMQGYAGRHYWEAAVNNWRNGDVAIQGAGTYWWIEHNRAKNSSDGLWFWLEARWTAAGHIYIRYNHLDANGRRAMGFSSGGDLRYGGFLVKDHHIDHNEIINVRYGKNNGLRAIDSVAGVQKYFVGSYNEVGRCGSNSSFSYNRLNNSPVAIFLSHDYTIAFNEFDAPDIDGGGAGAKYLVEFGRQTSGTTDTSYNIYFHHNKGFVGNGVLYHFNRGEVLQHIVIDHNNISLNTASTKGPTNLAFFARPNGGRRHSDIVFSNNIFSGHMDINPAFVVDLNNDDNRDRAVVQFINNDFRATNITSQPAIYNYTPFKYHWKRSGNRYSDGKTDK